MNRRQLRGAPLDRNCRRAHTMTEFNGDTVCFGLMGDGFHEHSYMICEKCSKCGAQAVNWEENLEKGNNGGEK